VRDPITPAADDPIERLAGGCQIGAGRGRDDALNQGINDGVGYAGEILRAFEGRSLG
jgi:hypothetical protein